MQEINRQGDSKLTDNNDMKPDVITKFIEALNNPDNQSVSLHKPGSIISTRDGAKHKVQKNGNWKMIQKPRYNRNRGR